MENEDFITYEEVEKILTEVIEKFLIPHFLSLGMNATGEWRDNIHARGNSIWGRHYTQQLVYGRRPGSFAPIESLIKWVEAKFGLSGREAVNIAWAVNHKIKNEGTNYFQEGGTDLIEILQKKEIEDYIVSQASNIIQNKLVFQIREEIKRTLL